MENMQKLEEGTRGRYQFVGVSLVEDGLAAYVEHNRMQFPVLHQIPTAIVDAYHLGGTPETIVISPQGTVVSAWSGAYDKRLASEIEDQLKVKLPGMAPTAPVKN
jgi:hypothetical protein